MQKESQTRRSFIKTAALGVAGIAGAGLLGGCSTQANSKESESAVNKATCFYGKSAGCKGDVSAFVEISDGKIVSIAAGDNVESEGRGDVAFDILSQKILESQSINVDTVTGATLSSMGYLNAIKQAVESAGMTKTFDISATVETPKRADEEYDVVVVGAGGSGLMAALTLLYPNYDNVKSETKVIVIEKQDIIGGSTGLSYGGCAVGDGLQANDTLNHHVSPDQMVDLLMKRNSDGVNEPLARAIFSKAADTVTKISALAGPYSTSYTGTVKKYSGYTYLQIDANLNQVLSDVDAKVELGSYTNQGGYALASFLSNKVRQAGCEIRTGTKAEKLIIENGAVCGVEVSEGSSQYNLKAKKVILACGGFTYSEKYMKELVGDMVPSYTPWCGSGATGDAFDLTSDLDAVRVGEGALVYFSLDPQLGMFSDLNNTYRKRNEIIVNEEGKRMLSEDQDEYYIAYHISQATNGHAFAIVDSDNPNIKVFEKWVDRGKVKKADSIEELAQQCGISPEGLSKTIEDYNNAYDKNELPEFETPHEAMYPIKNGPFYAGEISICIIGSLVGLKVNENCQILNSKDVPIEGLYGVGEVCLGGNILSMYYSGGCSIATALNTGRLSAEHIIATL